MAYFKSLSHNPTLLTNSDMSGTTGIPLSQTDMMNMQNVYTQTQTLILEAIKCITSTCIAIKIDGTITIIIISHLSLSLSSLKVNVIHQIYP